MGKKVATLFGKWDDSLYYVGGDVNVKPKDFTSSNATLLWKRTKPPPNLTRYNLTSFAITLNELTPGLKVQWCIESLLDVGLPFSSYASLILCYSLFSDRVFDHGLIKEKLPPTDSRLRPDQRHLENGEYEKANLEKQRLEKRQRMVCWKLFRV